MILQASNILFVDQPIGTGFSYSSDKRDIRHNENDVSDDLYDFIQVGVIYFPICHPPLEEHWSLLCCILLKYRLYNLLINIPFYNKGRYIRWGLMK